MPTSFDVVKMTQEGYKLYFETFKHLTTLNTASILILATLLDKVVKHPQSAYLIPLSLSAFLLSIVCCAGAMMFFAKMTGELSHIDMSLDADEAWRTKNREFRKMPLAGVSIVFGGAGFIFGLLCLVIFVVKNT